VPLPAIGADRAIDIRDFGAAGDGKTLCTAAIQKAIDRCAARGGGTVRLPEGTWLTGTVYLQSNLTLVLEKGCTLLGSRKHEDYGRARASADAAGSRAAPFRYAAVLAGSDLRNVTIRGEGVIDGQGDAFRDKSKLRPKNLYLQRCRNVVLRDIAAENTSQTGCSITGLPGHPIRDVVLENVRIGFDDVKRLEIESLEAGCAKGAAAVLRLAQVEGAVVRRSTAPAHADPFLLLEGDRTRQIVLEQLDLSRAVQGVHRPER
jgi:polygalacturonase